MFVKNKMIDKAEVQRVVKSRDLITYDSLEKEWYDRRKNSNELGIESTNEEFNFYKMYEISFSIILDGLTLDELEYLNENNLFSFDKNNILDYKCKMIINRRIIYYKQILSDLINGMQKENIGSYFGKFGDLFRMSVYGLQIASILGLDRDSAELTPDGKKLKACIDNIKQLHETSIRQKLVTPEQGPILR